MSKLETELIAKYGQSQRERIQRGLKQVTSFWRTEDGARDVFEDFVRANFAGDQATLYIIKTGERAGTTDLPPSPLTLSWNTESVLTNIEMRRESA
jgi:hypothetical protein